MISAQLPPCFRPPPSVECDPNLFIARNAKVCVETVSFANNKVNRQGNIAGAREKKCWHDCINTKEDATCFRAFSSGRLEKSTDRHRDVLKSMGCVVDYGKDLNSQVNHQHDWILHICIWIFRSELRVNAHRRELQANAILSFWGLISQKKKKKKKSCSQKCTHLHSHIHSQKLDLAFRSTLCYSLPWRNKSCCYRKWSSSWRTLLMLISQTVTCCGWQLLHTETKTAKWKTATSRSELLEIPNVLIAKMDLPSNKIMWNVVFPYFLQGSWIFRGQNHSHRLPESVIGGEAKDFLLHGLQRMYVLLMLQQMSLEHFGCSKSGGCLKKHPQMRRLLLCCTRTIPRTPHPTTPPGEDPLRTTRQFLTPTCAGTSPLCWKQVTTCLSSFQWSMMTDSR